MNGERRRAFVVAGLMCSAAVLAPVARPRVHLTDQRGPADLDALFPRRFGDWGVDEQLPVVLPAPDVQAAMDRLYHRSIARAYLNGAGERIMLSVAYGGDQSDATRAHQPEVCYPAQGFEIVTGRRGALSAGNRTIATRQLVARLGARLEPITYWTVVGTRVTTSGTEQKLAQLRYGVRGVVPDGLLVRVSSIGVDTDAAYALHARFVAALADGLPENARERVLGAR